MGLDVPPAATFLKAPPAEETRFLRNQQQLLGAAFQSQQVTQVLAMAFRKRLLDTPGVTLPPEVTFHLNALVDSVVPTGHWVARAAANGQLRMRDLSVADAVPKRSRELLRSRPLGTAEVFGPEVESFLEESTRAQRVLDQEAWLRQTLEVQAGANKPPGTGAGRGQPFSQQAKGAPKSKRSRKARKAGQTSKPSTRGRGRGFRQPASATVTK